MTLRAIDLMRAYEQRFEVAIIVSQDSSAGESEGGNLLFRLTAWCARTWIHIDEGVGEEAASGG